MSETCCVVVWWCRSRMLTEWIVTSDSSLPSPTSTTASTTTTLSLSAVRATYDGVTGVPTARQRGTTWETNTGLQSATMTASCHRRSGRITGRPHIVFYSLLSPVSTTRVYGWPVSITRKHGPCWRARVSTSRVDPSTRPVLTGNGNRSPVNSGL